MARHENCKNRNNNSTRPQTIITAATRTTATFSGLNKRRNKFVLIRPVFPFIIPAPFFRVRLYKLKCTHMRAFGPGHRHLYPHPSWHVSVSVSVSVYGPVAVSVMLAAFNLRIFMQTVDRQIKDTTDRDHGFTKCRTI